MDDAFGFRRILPIGIDMCHHVMANLLFFGGYHFIIDGLNVRFQRIHLCLRNG